MKRAALTSKPEPSEADLQALVAAARAQAERAANSALVAGSLLTEAKAILEKVQALTASVEANEVRAGEAAGLALHHRLEIDKAVKAAQRAVAGVANSDAITCIDDATKLTVQGPAVVFSCKHDALMRWWEIEPNGAGSSSVVKGMPKLDVPIFKGYASVELGTLFWLPDSTFVNGALITRGLLTTGSDFTADEYPALAALAAFYGMLQPLDNGRFTVNFTKTTTQPFTNGAAYIVCH